MSASSMPIIARNSAACLMVKPTSSTACRLRLVRPTAHVLAAALRSTSPVAQKPLQRSRQGSPPGRVAPAVARPLSAGQPALCLCALAGLQVSSCAAATCCQVVFFCAAAGLLVGTLSTGFCGRDVAGDSILEYATASCGPASGTQTCSSALRARSCALQWSSGVLGVLCSSEEL